jgi:hypothetical protein
MSPEVKPSSVGVAFAAGVGGVYDDAGNVIETHEHKGEFKELVTRQLY